MNIENYEQKKQRWIDFWNKENHDRPIITLTAPNGRAWGLAEKSYSSITEKWMDIEQIVKIAKKNARCTYFAAEAFPLYHPNLGPDILGAAAGGCEIEFAEDTSWAVHGVSDWNSLPAIRFDENNKWYKKILEMTEYAAKESNGEYITGITDLHPGTDGLVSLRGPESFCIDLIENPNEIKKRMDEIFVFFKKMYEGLDNAISPYQEGTANWAGIWHPAKKWYITSSDFCCLVGKEQFDEFVAPGLTDESRFLDASIYHLDGPGALRHLDRLLRIEELDGIQWVYGDGQPTAKHWIDVYKKVQNAGKLVQVFATDTEEVKAVCENLRPEGVHILCCFGMASKDEADAFLKQTIEWSRK